jgi:2-polyprenyl-3-methyl-5-hydroxy-6-metoxy-1,4-benzoquinol methylase
VSPTALRRIDCARSSFDLCNQPRTAADRFDQKMQADTEEYLREAAGRGHEMVQAMVQKLSGALIYPDAGNVQTNEKLWDVYASEWGAEAGWVAGMAASNRDEAERLENVGDEWAPAAHTKRVVDEWILSEVSLKTQCCEIGSGGGRIGRMVAPRVAKLQCFDVSAKMLAAAKRALASEENVAFAQIHGDASGADAGFCDKPRHYAPEHKHAYDFVYCFDVMVHMDAHAMFRCLKRIRALLKDDGKAFISTSNLLAPDGFRRFETQEKYSVGGFYFVTPETVRCLVARAGLRVVRDLTVPDASNTYYNRDYLAVLAPVVVDAAATAPVVEAPAMDEDAILDAVEAAEAAGDCAAVVGLLGSALALDEPETAVEAVADALLRLGTAHAAALGEAGACERVCAALALPCCGEEPSLAEVLLGCCRVLAKTGANAAKLLANDGAARLVSAMEAHVASGEPTLQEQGCLAIEALAAAGGAAALREAGAEAAIEGARGDIVNERNKTYPDRALTALAGS